MLRLQLEEQLTKKEEKQSILNDMIADICAVVHVLFKRISCSTDALKYSLAFDDHVTRENIKVYLSMIEQRCMELICILKFIGLHQVNIITISYIIAVTIIIIILIILVS